MVYLSRTGVRWLDANVVAERSMRDYMRQLSSLLKYFISVCAAEPLESADVETINKEEHRSVPFIPAAMLLISNDAARNASASAEGFIEGPREFWTNPLLYIH